MLPNKFFALGNRKLFLKTKNWGKKQLPNIALNFDILLYSNLTCLVGNNGVKRFVA